MTGERTEEAGLSGFLTLTMGGQPVRLRALTYDESETWLGLYATALAGTEVMEGESSEEQMRSLVTHASKAALELVLAYDIDGVLGGSETVRKRATRRELATALEMMVTVEDPLVETAPRLAASVFGLPSQLAAERMEEVNEPVLRLVRSLNTLSAPGASTSTGTSGTGGPRSSSSSTGRTRRNATAGRPTSAAS